MEKSLKVILAVGILILAIVLLNNFLGMTGKVVGDAPAATNFNLIDWFKGNLYSETPRTPTEVNILPSPESTLIGRNPADCLSCETIKPFYDTITTQCGDSPAFAIDEGEKYIRQIGIVTGGESCSGVTSFPKSVLGERRESLIQRIRSYIEERCTGYGYSHCTLEQRASEGYGNPPELEWTIVVTCTKNL